MSSYAPPRAVLDIFNDSDYQHNYGTITLFDADSRYLKITGGNLTGMLYANNGLSASSIYSSGTCDVGSLKIGGNTVDLSSITGVSNGSISANKACIVDANKDVSGFRNLSATNLTGTLQTASQTNITSLGTLTQLDFSNAGCNAVIRPTSNYLYMGTSSNSDLDFLIERHGIFVARFSPLGLKLSSSLQASYPLDVVGDISGTGNWRNGSTILMDPSGVLQTAGQTNITSLGSLTGLTLNGILSSSSGLIDTSSSLRITNGNVPSNGSGGGFRYSGINSTFYISAHNHFLSTHNRIDIQDHIIWISGGSDTPSDAVAFNTNNPAVMSKWTFHQASNTSNHLRMNYSDAVYSDQYCDSAGIHRFTNQISAPSYGIGGTALTFNDSVNISGSSILSSIEHLALSYSQANHAGNISAVDTSQNQMNINIGDRFRISAYNATIPYSVGFGGYPAGSALPDAFTFYQASSTSTKMRIAYDTGSNYSQIWCGSDSKLNVSTELTAKGLNAGVSQVPISAVVNIGGDSGKIDVGTNSSKILEFHGTNATPTVGYLLMSNDSGSTATNAMTFGTYSTTNINFYTHNTHVMTVAQGKVGVGYGNTSPTYPLDVAGNVTWSYGGTAYWLKANVGGGLQSGSGGSFAISLKVSDNILCSDSVANYSDERLKDNIENIDISFDSYMKHCVPKRYNRIDRNNQPQIGFIAQELIQAVPLLVQGIKNEKMKKRNEMDPDDGIQLTVDYTRMTAINCCVIRKLIDRIEKLEQKLSETL